MPRVSQYLLQKAGVPYEENTGITSEQNAKLPTSLELLMDGLEIFMYNRTVAYDNILETLKKADKGSETLDQSFSSESASDQTTSPASDHSLGFSDVTVASSDTYPLKFFLLVLPLQVRIKRGVFVLGNHTTPSIMLASFKTGKAILDISKAPSLLDCYRMSFEIAMEKFQISLKTNITYDPLKYCLQNESKSAAASNSAHSRTAKFHSFINKFLSRGRLRVAPGENSEWHGLRRYADGFETDRKLELNDVEEYAKYSLILDSVSTQLTYYYDMPGVHPPKDMYEDSCPKFGVDLELSMATVHYGSWADRQRGPLQTLLFPPLSRDSEPSVISKEPGAPRSYAGFDLLIRNKDELILRVPTREFSKHMEDLSALNSVPKQQKSSRPFGWLELKLGPGSDINSFTSYVAYSSGYPNTANIHAMDLEVRSSVNHDILFSAGEHKLNCDIGFPLKWNGECVWKFDMCSQNAKFFFLREHIFLLTDLVTDFGSGPPAPYENQRPFEYQLKWQVKDFRLYFNVNDHNIINDPLDFNNNKYLCFKGEELNVVLNIPLKGPFSKSAKVDYKITTKALDLYLKVPPWHTVSAFMKGDKRMGSTGAFEVSGYYSYYNAVELDHHNFCVINAIGDDISLLFYGYFIRYLFTLRENYFGDFKTFKTFEEYTHGLNSDEIDSQAKNSMTETEDPDYWKIFKRENDMNVLFTFLVRRGMIILPCQIYDHEHHISLCFDLLDVDIHLNHYYMDLQADFSSASGYYFKAGCLPTSELIFDIPRYQELVSSRPAEIFIDGFSVHTHRMFGLAPDLLTYQCKWDFASALIQIQGDPLCLTGLQSVVRSFALGFTDLENTLIYLVPIIYDAASFSFRCPEIKIKLDTGIDNVFFEVDLLGMLVNFNDIANLRYSSRISVSIPEIIAKIIDENKGVLQNAYLKTSLMLTDICQKQKMLEHRRNQQQHVRQSDAPTHRAPFLVFPENKDAVYMEALGSLFPSVSLPSASFPLTKEYEELHGVDSACSLESLSLKASLHLEMDSGEFDQMKPTVDYDDKDFAPQTEPTPGIKYDAFIIEFDVMDVFMSPAGIGAFANLATKFRNTDLNFLIDQLQLESVKSLKRLIFPIPMIDNIRFVCPTIDVKIASAGFEDPRVVFCSSPLVPVVTLSIVEPSLALSAYRLRVRRQNQLIETEYTSLAFHCREIYASAHNPDCFGTAFNVTLRDLELWLSKDPAHGMVGSMSLDKLGVGIETVHLKWLLEYLVTLLGHIDDALKPLRSSSRASTWRSELIYMLVKTIRDNDIVHDPEVITKPARILRSCEDHVRFYDSWKLVVKLRSILDELPNFEAENDRFRLTHWIAPADAFDQVVEYFKNWRVWEAKMGQRMEFLSSKFGKEESTINDIKGCIRLNSVEMQLKHGSGTSDTVLIQEFRYHVSKSEEVLAGKAESTLHFNLVINTESFDVSLSPNLLDAVKILSEHLPQKKQSGEPPVVAGHRKSLLLMSLISNVNILHIHCDFRHNFWDFYAYKNTLSVQTNELTPGDITASIAAQSKDYTLSFGTRKTELMRITLNDLQASTSGLKREENYAGVIDVDLGMLDAELLDHEGALIPAMDDFINKDLTDLKENLASTKSLSLSQSETSVPRKGSNLPNFKVDFLIKQATCSIELFHPLRFHGRLVNNRLRFGHSSDDISLEYSYKSMSSELRLAEITILRTENFNLNILSYTTKLNDMWLIDSVVNLGYMKMTSPLIVNATEGVLKYTSCLKERLKSITDIAKSSQSDGKQKESSSLVSKDAQSKGFDPSDKIAFRVRVTQEYCGWSMNKENCRHSLEFEGLKALIANVGNSTDSIESTVPIWGEILVLATRFTVLDPSIPVGLSTLLDLNFSAKILNDVAAQESDTPLQSLQIESEYSRICLSPPVIFKVQELMYSMKNVLSKYEKGTADSDISKTEPVNAIPMGTHATNSRARLHFSSVHFLSYNFCIGWLFGTSHKDYPGFIMGSERIFAVTKADIGKLTMMDGYLSVANGSTSSSFYSRLSEMDSLNRAFMHQIQLNYCVTEEDKLWITLMGDELDVKFMSNSVVIIERAIKSFTQVQSFFEQQVRRDEKRKLFTAKLKPGSSSKPPTERNFRPHFTNIQLITRFAGSKVYIYRLHEENLPEEPSSLSLHSPVVQVAILYERLKDQQKEHSLRAEVLMSPSDNTVYSSCVPVVMDFVDAFKEMFRSPKPDEAHIPRSLEHPEVSSNPAEPSTDFGKLLKEIDFHVGIIIEKQRFSLSCEPTARVAAVVEHDGASLLATSGLGGQSSVYVLGKINSISASLQHVYSDERSGLIDIRTIMFSSTIDFVPDLDVVSTLCVSEINGYVKMKQSQDLDLFSDIWYPKEYKGQAAKQTGDVSGEHKSSLSSKDAPSRSKEISTTSAIPFALSVIICNFSLEVDLGPSLGVVVLDVDRAWALSRKTSNWFYEFNLGMNTLTVGCDGRLGGYLKVERLLVRSSIEWKLKDLPFLDVPLVHLSGGFQRVQLKNIFDDHVFAFADLEGWKLNAYNQKNGINISKDHLFVVIGYDSAEIYLTSLAASDFYDIYSAITRMIEEKRTSYKEILNDSKKDKFVNRSLSSDLLEVAKKLETKIEVITGMTRFQVFPHSFADSRALVIRLDRSSANFVQNEYELGVFNEVELQLNSVNASFSTVVSVDLEAIKSFDVDQFLAYAKKTKGGSIIGFPKFMISMRTYQEYSKHIVEYLFQSSFGGTVDIRWNLGSVNIVREMYAAHKRAIRSRMEYSNNDVLNLERFDLSDPRLRYDGIISGNDLDPLDPGADTHRDIDNDIQDTIEKVTNTSKFTYRALAPPIIEAPQLKELGTATPPLEWFGLHRNKFPDATHQLVIVTLQKLISEVEGQYSKALGKA